MKFNELIYRLLKRRQSGTQYRTLLQVLHLDIILLLSVSLLIIFAFFILYIAAYARLLVIKQEMLHIGFCVFLIFFFS